MAKHEMAWFTCDCELGGCNMQVCKTCDDVLARDCESN